jgi:uncharacterized protein YecE (DUF72 family)
MIYIGTSGWQYDDWRGRFYPKAIRDARTLTRLLGERRVELHAAS